RSGNERLAAIAIGKSRGREISGYRRRHLYRYENSKLGGAETNDVGDEQHYEDACHSFACSDEDVREEESLEPRVQRAEVSNKAKRLVPDCIARRQVQAALPQDRDQCQDDRCHEGDSYSGHETKARDQQTSDGRGYEDGQSLEDRL